MPKGVPKNGINKGWIKKGQTLKKGVPCSLGTRQKLREINTGKKLSEKTKEILRVRMLGNNYALGKKQRSHFGHKQTIETRIKISENLSKAKMGIPQWHMRGSKNNHWKGGITPKNRAVRNSLEYRLWYRSVFERDNWTCQKTGLRGVELHAHHVLNFAEYPELRFAIDNGITLSKEAHNEFHRIYGKKNNTREQLLEFLKN
jgi:hypothetical protein